MEKPPGLLYAMAPWETITCKQAPSHRSTNIGWSAFHQTKFQMCLVCYYEGILLVCTNVYCLLLLVKVGGNAGAGCIGTNNCSVLVTVSDNPCGEDTYVWCWHCDNAASDQDCEDIGEWMRCPMQNVSLEMLNTYDKYIFSVSNKVIAILKYIKSFTCYLLHFVS